MGSSATENIAIQIDTSADVGALQTARDEVTSLGKAAKQASDDMSSGFDKTSTSTDRFARSLQQSEEGVERSRGATRGMALEAGHLSAALVLSEGGMMGLVRASGLLATEMAEVSGVASVAASASAIGAVVTVIATVIGLFVEATNEVDKFKSSLDGLSGLSSHQLDIQMTAIRGEIDSITSRMASTSQLLFSPDWAKLNRDNGKLLQMQKELYDQLLEAQKSYIEAKKREEDNGLAASLEDERQSALDRVNLSDEQASIAKVNREEVAHEAEIRRMHLNAEEETQLLIAAEQDRDAQIAAIHKAADDRAAEEAQRTAARARAIGSTIAEETQAALDQVALSEESAAIAKVSRDEKRREQEIRDLHLQLDEETELILAAQADRDAQISAIHKRASDREAQEQKRADDEAARRQEAATQRQIDAIESVLSASVRSSDSYMKVVTKTLLTPLEHYLEGLAVSQLVDAAISVASLDFVGAAAHTAAAALALEGARKVAQIGGLNSSGGGGSGAAGSGGSGSLSTPAQNQGSPVVVQLYTSDPYNRQNIMIASYQLNRAGITKRPIYLPPTTGLQTAPG